MRPVVGSSKRPGGRAPPVMLHVRVPMPLDASTNAEYATLTAPALIDVVRMLRPGPEAAIGGGVFAGGLMLASCAATAAVMAVTGLKSVAEQGAVLHTLGPTVLSGSRIRSVILAVSPGASVNVALVSAGFSMSGLISPFRSENTGFGTFVRTTFCTCSRRVQSFGPATGVLYIRRTINWSLKPAGTCLFSSKRVLYEAVVFPLFLTFQETSLISPLRGMFSISGFSISGFSISGFSISGFSISGC